MKCSTVKGFRWLFPVLLLVVSARRRGDLSIYLSSDLCNVVDGRFMVYCVFHFEGASIGG